MSNFEEEETINENEILWINIRPYKPIKTYDLKINEINFIDENSRKKIKFKIKEINKDLLEKQF